MADASPAQPLSPPAAPSSEEDKMDLQIRRILAFKNPFDVLEVPLDVTADDLQKRYKVCFPQLMFFVVHLTLLQKLALVLHPDKCKHPKADDAFSAVKKAMKVLETPGRLVCCSVSSLPTFDSPA